MLQTSRAITAVLYSIKIYEDIPCCGVGVYVCEHGNASPSPANASTPIASLTPLLLLLLLVQLAGWTTTGACCCDNVAEAINLPHLNSCMYGQQPISSLLTKSFMSLPFVPTFFRHSKPGIECIIIRLNSNGSDRGLIPFSRLEKYCTYLRCDGMVNTSTVVPRLKAMYSRDSKGVLNSAILTIHTYTWAYKE